MFQLEVTDPGVLQDHGVPDNNLAEQFIEDGVLTSFIPVFWEPSQEDRWSRRVTFFLNNNNNKIPACLAFNVEIAIFVSLFRCVVVLNMNVFHFPWYTCMVIGIS